MPAFDGGAISIVVCPDADPMMAMAPMGPHDHRHDKLHQPCPFAAASATGAFSPKLELPVAILMAAAALLLGRGLILPVQDLHRVRPPSRGPPLPA